MAKQKQKKTNKNEESLEAGRGYLSQHALFGTMDRSIHVGDRNLLGKNSYACVYSYGAIFLNKDVYLAPKEWAYVIAHCMLHLAFGHFDAERMPGFAVEQPDGSFIWKVQCNKSLWNTACDLYITKFLWDIKFGTPVHENPVNLFQMAFNDERKIYQALIESNYPEGDARFSTLASGQCDMIGLEKPLVYLPKQQNQYSANFAYALASSVSEAVSEAGGHHQKGKADTPARRAAAWFIDHYPLLGGLAAHFKIVEDYQYCVKNEISVAAGLIEEIRALSMPPIPWDVELANWFDVHFAPLERYRSYARPSRRQASTPDIPRPRYQTMDILTKSRTFGVVIDTSGSMEPQLIGKALGAVASYAASHEVPFARVVFCDAQAYDAGYVSPEDIAGRVAVKGRGGTALQPGIDLLEQAQDFPKDGPILIITDGMIEERMSIRHEHAWLLPSGRWLPFRTRMPVFYFD